MTEGIGILAVSSSRKLTLLRALHDKEVLLRTACYGGRYGGAVAPSVSFRNWGWFLGSWWEANCWISVTKEDLGPQGKLRCLRWY